LRPTPTGPRPRIEPVAALPAGIFSIGSAVIAAWPVPPEEQRRWALSGAIQSIRGIWRTVVESGPARGAELTILAGEVGTASVALSSRDLAVIIGADPQADPVALRLAVAPDDFTLIAATFPPSTPSSAETVLARRLLSMAAGQYGPGPSPMVFRYEPGGTLAIFEHEGP
jgi:hypothetical protein